MRGITLDHVAVAVERWRDAFPRFVHMLGGEWVSGGYAPVFSPSQYRFGNRMRLELLMPGQRGGDFVRRFLDSHGPGPHHLTFKVADIGEAIDAIHAAGIEPHGVDVSDPMWREAFLHPRSSRVGLVVQVAESDAPPWTTPAPAGYPDELPPAADLAHVGLAVADIDAALAVFRDLLRGEPVDEGDGDGERWVELAWPGPGRVRLLSPASDDGPLVRWLDGRDGRVHHLAFAVDEGVAGGSSELEPDEATGTRLRLLPRRG